MIVMGSRGVSEPPIRSIADVDQRLCQLRATWLHHRDQPVDGQVGPGVDLELVYARMDELLLLRFDFMVAERFDAIADAA